MYIKETKVTVFVNETIMTIAGDSEEEVIQK